MSMFLNQLFSDFTTFSEQVVSFILLFILHATWRHFRKIEEVLNGYVTNPNPTPTLTTNH